MLLSLFSESVFAQMSHHMTPHQQMQMSNDPTQIQCREGLVLMVRSNGNPMCLNPSTYWIFADRSVGNFDTELLAKNQNHIHGVMGAMINHPQMSQHMQTMMNHMMNDPQSMQTMHGMMMQNPQHMHGMMNKMMGPMMNHMMNDPQMQQQMMNHMINHPQMMQQWMQNPQYVDSLSDYSNDKPETSDDSMSSQSAQVSIALGSASPGCEETNECYLPYSVSISEHSSVTWTNDDTTVHTATSGNPTDGPDGIFDSGLISAGDMYTNQFDEEGTFDYYCIAHPWMAGKVVVLE